MNFYILYWFYGICGVWSGAPAIFFSIFCCKYVLVFNFLPVLVPSSSLKHKRCMPRH